MNFRIWEESKQRPQGVKGNIEQQNKIKTDLEEKSEDYNNTKGSLTGQKRKDTDKSIRDIKYRLRKLIKAKQNKQRVLRKD